MGFTEGFLDITRSFLSVFDSVYMGGFCGVILIVVGICTVCISLYSIMARIIIWWHYREK